MKVERVVEADVIVMGIVEVEDIELDDTEDTTELEVEYVEGLNIDAVFEGFSTRLILLEPVATELS